MTTTVSYQGQLGTATGSGATLGVTASAAPVGSLVVVYIGSNINAGSVSGVSDTGGNTWKRATGAVNGATYPNAAIYWASITNGTLGTVTVSFNATVPTASSAAVHCYTVAGGPAGWDWGFDYGSFPNDTGSSSSPSDFQQSIYAAGVKVSVLVAATTTATISNFNGSAPSSAGFVERSRTVASPITLWAIDNIGLTGVNVYAGPNLSASVAWQMLGGNFYYGPVAVRYASANSTAGGANPTLVVTMGAPSSASNILVAFCASNAGSDFTAPGWTSAGISGGNRTVAVLWRVGDGNTAYTFTRLGGAAGDGLDIAVWEFSGIDLVTPIDLHVRTDSSGAQASPAALTGGTAAANTLQLAWFVMDGNTAGSYLTAYPFVLNWPTDNGNAPTQFTDPTGKVTVYEYGRFATVSTSVAPSVVGWPGSIIWTGAVVTLNGASPSMAPTTAIGVGTANNATTTGGLATTTATTHKAYTGATSVLTTGLNSLANQAMSAVGATFDNHIILDMLCDIQVTIAAQGAARAFGATVEVYILYSFDGVTFNSLVRGISAIAAMIYLDPSTTARVRTVTDVPLCPGYMRFALLNNTGQALAAAGNIVSVDPHSVRTV